MLAIIILVVLIILILVSLLLIKNRQISQRKKTLYPLLAIILLLPGGYVLFSAEKLILQAWEKKSWPETEGIIIKSVVAGKRAFHPEITYKFDVENHIFQNTTALGMSGFGNKRSRRDTATRIIEKYPVNTQVTVRYNPDNPQESYLRIGPFWSDYMKLMVGMILCALGLFLGFSWILSMIRN
jgi:hypothetical protein